MTRRPNESKEHGTKTQTGQSLAVKTGIRAGRITTNHSRSALKVKTAVRAGRIAVNHNRRAL
jgi:hypothetical protein